MYTKVSSLNIKEFRRFKDIILSFGDRVTLIAGQNGTSKSTLLGMLAQPFSFGILRGSSAGNTDNSSYTNNYHGIALSKFMDLTGKHFMYDCDNVFRLSKQYDSNDKVYKYRTTLSGLIASKNSPLKNDTLFTQNRSRTTTEKGVRFVTGPKASHKSGEGNFPHPVIYLGLNRLWPLAEVKNCTFTKDTLTSEDKEWYVDKYNQILCLNENNNHAKFMNTPEKRKFITPESTNYDGESCSAGQDNLSQILTAILSFRKLKNDLGDKYRGGILLIDELDATLHAWAQDKLLELLCKESEDLGLQIIATTHSLRLIENVYHSELKKNIKLLYLINKDGLVINENFSSFQEVSDHLKVQSTLLNKGRKNKVSIIFEDEEGKNFFQQICGSKLRNYLCSTCTSSFGAGYLKTLADLSKNIPELQSVIFVPDGDMAKTWARPPKAILPLPGDKRPETLIYQHLFNMAETDAFWGSISRTYTRQVAITSKGGNSVNKGDDKAWVKSWYTNQSPYWGNGKNKVFKSWVQNNKKECLVFFNKFIKLLQVRYKCEIPKNVIDNIRENLTEPSHDKGLFS